MEIAQSEMTKEEKRKYKKSEFKPDQRRRHRAVMYVTRVIILVMSLKAVQ
jgi:hypothetical protein